MSPDNGNARILVKMCGIQLPGTCFIAGLGAIVDAVQRLDEAGRLAGIQIECGLLIRHSPSCCSPGPE